MVVRPGSCNVRRLGGWKCQILNMFFSSTYRLSGPTSKNIKQHSLGPVLWCVAIATLGAFSFGYHASIVNGPLGAIAADLGFAGDAAKAGLVSQWNPIDAQCVLPI